MIDKVQELPTASSGFSLVAVLRLDAVTCAGMGMLLVAAANPLASLLGLPAAVLTWAGVLLLPSALLMLIASRQRPPAAALVILIVIGNLTWVAASVYVAMTASGVTTLGELFLWVQLLVVAVLAVLEWRGTASRHR